MAAPEFVRIDIDVRLTNGGEMRVLGTYGGEKTVINFRTGNKGSQNYSVTLDVPFTDFLALLCRKQVEAAADHLEQKVPA